jgi:hypothetical protein
MNLKDLISEAEYAAARGVSVRTIQYELARRVGPPFIKLGSKVLYRPAAIDAWLLAKESNSQPSKKSA